MPNVGLDDPEYEEKKKQWNSVEEFFSEFKNPDGSYRGFYTEYHHSTDFEVLLEQQLRDLITRYLAAHPTDKTDSHAVTEGLTRDEQRMLNQAKIEAEQWEKHQHDLAYLWHVDRLKMLHQTIQHLDGTSIPDVVWSFARPQKVLMNLLENRSLTHDQRLNIGLYLAELGDPRPGVGLCHRASSRNV